VLEVKLIDIPEGGMTVEGEISPEEMDVHEPSFSIGDPVKVRLLVEIVDDVFVAKGAYSGVIGCRCDRCLKPFEIRPSRTDYLFGKELDPSDETIDLTEGILEDILLGLPMKMLCSETCKGICPQCGTDLNLGKCTCKPRSNATPFSELDKLM
jgi:uncharacterized protein